MPPFLRSRPALVGLALVVLALGAVGFLPLFDGPGYESALAAGLILPLIVAVVTGLELSAARVQPLDALARGLANGGAFALLGYLLTLAHGLRAGFCDLLGGSTHFALGPACGALLAGAWGALAGDRAAGQTRRWARLSLAVLLAVAGPLGSILISVGRFYGSPMVFAYDPFVGYFSGSLYDTVVGYDGLVSYRAGSAATLFATYVAALHLERDESDRLRLRSSGRPGLIVLGALALIGSVTCTLEGDRLGHYQSPAGIAETLGAVVTGQRCKVIYPRSVKPADAERFTRDCDALVVAGERWLELKGPPQITAYLFADAGQKAALMGAADTYIAKPWRREIYLQNNGYPQPALGHEIIHVLAGSMARGPFKVAGSLGGFFPNPGLIEGVAVAASPREGDLTPREWARAMKDLGILPPLGRLFALGFFGESSTTAYTVSGAFVGWIKERFGATVIQAWYGGKDLPELTGQSWAALEKEWHESLATVVLPEAARAVAKARFGRPGIFGRRCPHVVDGCREQAERLRGSGDDEGAIAKYKRALTLDPNDRSLDIAIARARIRMGKVDEGTLAIETIAQSPEVPRFLRDRALEELGDLDLGAGRGESAVARYREVMERIVDEDQLRTLEVKILAAQDARVRPSVVALLIGPPGRSPDKLLAAELLGAWEARLPEPASRGAAEYVPDLAPVLPRALDAPVALGDGLPLYLIGRQLLNAGNYDEAANRLDRAITVGFSLSRVRVEAHRLRLVAACAQNDSAAALRSYQVYASLPGVSEARRDAARSLVERCTGKSPEAVRFPGTGAPAPAIIAPGSGSGQAATPGRESR
jgi:tetratricopeptide (TPR) repeat protein